MTSSFIRQVRPWGGELSDIAVADGRISSITPHKPAAAGTGDGAGAVVEGGGRLLLPSFSDVHVHLDSNRLGLPFREHTGAPGVWGMMMNDRNNWRLAETSILDRYPDERPVSAVVAAARRNHHVPGVDFVRRRDDAKRRDRARLVRRTHLLRARVRRVRQS